MKISFAELIADTTPDTVVLAGSSDDIVVLSKRAESAIGYPHGVGNGRDLAFGAAAAGLMKLPNRVLTGGRP